MYDILTNIKSINSMIAGDSASTARAISHQDMVESRTARLVYLCSGSPRAPVLFVRGSAAQRATPRATPAAPTWSCSPGKKENQGHRV